MLPLETTITFFTASLLLALAPGPDNIFVLTQSALRGGAAGILVTLGLCTGLVVHTVAVACGAAVIFEQSTTAYSALKFVGAGYLLYLAWLAFTTGATKVPVQVEGRFERVRLYRRGIIMNLTNPKVSVFFLAFLPQFTDPSRGPVGLQIAMLGGWFILATILVFTAIAVLSGVLNQWFTKSDRLQTSLNWIAGCVFVGLALKLAGSQQ